MSNLQEMNAQCVVVSFEDIEYVSPSFLDETVVRLVEEHPEYRGSVAVDRLTDFAKRGLATVMAARRVEGTIELR